MCNLRCHSCGQWGDNGYLVGESLKDLKQREVPVEIYKNLVDQIVDEGWSPVWYIWGGEPMLYPGLIELMHYIKDRGMPISLVSNATNIARRARRHLGNLQKLSTERRLKKSNTLRCLSTDNFHDVKALNVRHDRLKKFTTRSVLGVSENYDNFKGC